MTKNGRWQCNRMGRERSIVRKRPPSPTASSHTVLIHFIWLIIQHTTYNSPSPLMPPLSLPPSFLPKTFNPSRKAKLSSTEKVSESYTRFMRNVLAASSEPSKSLDVVKLKSVLLDHRSFRDEQKDVVQALLSRLIEGKGFVVEVFHGLFNVSRGCVSECIERVCWHP